jgi:hypothetical protein
MDVFQRLGFISTEKRAEEQKQKKKQQKQNEEVHGINPMDFFR